MPGDPKLPEIQRGTEVFGVDPLTIRVHFEVDYIHSYKQDTPFFHGLAKRKLLGSYCPKCNYHYATPRSHCMYCGGKTDWFELPAIGRIHSWTVCYFAAEEFLKEVDRHVERNGPDRKEASGEIFDGGMIFHHGLTKTGKVLGPGIDEHPSAHPEANRDADKTQVPP